MARRRNRQGLPSAGRRGKRLRALAGWLLGDPIKHDGGPSYCAGCKSAGLSCADGRKGPAGRYCPEVANAPQTAEGAAFWRVIRRAMPFTGGGMSPVRLDRAEIRGRMAGVDRWIVDELSDDFEAAALAALAEAKAKQNTGGEDG